MAIDSQALQDLLKSQGILLEHQAKKVVYDYFESRKNSVIRNFGGLSYRSYSNWKSDFHEIDLLIEASIFYEKFKFSLKSKKEGELVSRIHNLTNNSLTNLFVIECKGHPSDGFLLCSRRAESVEPNHNILDESIYIKNSDRNRWNKGHVRRDKCNVTFVDWAYFYKVNDGKSKKKDGIYDKIVYQEDKGKFQKALDQMEIHIAVALEELESDKRKRASEPIRITPMLVTNSPLCLMSIKTEKASFKTIPWATYLHNFQNDHSLVANRIEFKNIHVVNFKYLTDFFKIYLEQDGDLSKFPSGSTETITGFEL